METVHRRVARVVADRQGPLRGPLSELARLAEDHDVNTISRSLVFRCGEFLRRDRGQNRLADNLVTTDDPGFRRRRRRRFPARPTVPGCRPDRLSADSDGRDRLYEDAYRATAAQGDSAAGE